MKQFLLIALLCITSNAFAYDFSIENSDGKVIYYLFGNSENEVSVCRSSLSRNTYNYYCHDYGGKIEIPESVVYNEKIYKVTSVSSNAFENCDELTSITIPNSVTTIGSFAFYDCDGLTSINIPNSITSIGDAAFQDCYRLTSVNISNSITSIGNSTFKSCVNLTSVTIPNGVISIGHSAFYGCEKISSITIPNSVTSINSNAFYDCKGLASVLLSNNITTIEPSTFYGCSNLTSIIIPNSVVSIGSNAFGNCSNLESVVIGVGVVTIKKDVFKDHIPAKVCWLPSVPPNGYDNAVGKVNYVVNDKYDTLSDKIIYPNLNSMFEADGIVYVPISFSERTCDIIDCLYDAKATFLDINKSVKYREFEMNVLNVQPYAFFSNQYIKNVKLDLEGEVPNYAFQNCINLESVELGGMVTCNGESSFEGCTYLSSLSMGNDLKKIKSSAFKNCQLLKDFKLGQNLEIIEKYSFSNCKSISEIKCPQQLIQINDYAFSGCSKIKKITIEENNGGSGYRRQILEDWSAGHYVSNYKNYIFEVKAGDKIVFDYYADCHYGSFLYIALNGKEIIHEDGYTKSYYVHTFTEAQKVTLQIELHHHLNSDGWSSAKVYNIEIGNNCRLSLGSNGKSSLFSDCELDEVYIGRKIVFPTSSDEGHSPFALITSLKSATISNKENILPSKLFYGCTNLSNVILDDNTEIIGDLSFYGCSRINHFEIGSKVTKIGEEAFSGCDGLTKLVCYAENPPVCGTYAIGGINKFNCTLYVPETSIADYKTAEQWKEFWNIQSLDPTNIDRNTLVPSQNYYHYDLNGNLLLQPRKGINILKSSNGKTKKVMVK